MLFRFLVLAALCLQSVLLEQSRILEQRKPFFERFRRLEEQFRRFQEVTLTRLQGIAENYNISYNIDARFQHITDRQQALTEAVNASSEGAQREQSGIKLWLKKLQRKNKKLDLKVSSLEEVMNERRKQASKDKKEKLVIMSNLTSELSRQKKLIDHLVKNKSILQKGIESFQEAVQRQGGKIAVLDKQLRVILQNEVLPPSALKVTQVLNRTPQEKQPEPPENDPGPNTVQQRMIKLETKHNQRRRLKEKQQLLIPIKSKKAQFTVQERKVTKEKSSAEEKTSDLQASTQPLSVTEVPKQQQEQRTRDYAKICNVDSMLVFPNSSTENFATFRMGWKEGLHELSICSWVRTNSNYLGTILSYATEENDNKLVLHGRNGAAYDSLHFVIGDPAFRELPVVPLLDGSWHHICFIWSSIQGKYWFYVDRRLASTGSRFQKGYEIPPGGSLVLGQEQDTLGGGFDSSEAFVGYLAGFAMWNRALLPGEVSGITTGKGLPRGTILTLADASSLHGYVQRVNCTCLEHCL
ncbi:pentraxin-4 [Ascaphus truei]|uniref:pentraxin-4 n=1 Tax=Ascaphus truei TaxID=8439 RepID=UPI003F595242